MHLLLTIKQKLRKVQILLNHLIDVIVLISMQHFNRENDNEFIIRLALQIGIQTSKSMLFQYDQFSMIFQNILKISSITIIRWYIIKDYNTFKIIVLLTSMIFYQIIQLLIVTSYSYAYKNIWINNEKMKKNNQMIEKLLYELPIGIILFNSNGEVQFQNSISYKYLPKSIDLVSKKYNLESVQKYSDLILMEGDQAKFQKVFEETLESTDPIIVSFAFQGHPIPICCHLRKQVFNKNSIVEAIFIEKSDDQSLIYDKISQSLQIMKIQQISEILSKQPERMKQQLLQSLFPMLNNTDYQKSDQIVCNLKNYFKFFADCLQIIYKTDPNVKIENDVPDQAFIDIVKLHSILTQLISYIYQEHNRKQMMQGFPSQRQLVQQSEKQVQREVNNFSLISFTISKGNELQVTIQIDYHNQIQELEMLFQRFDFEGLKSYDFRLQQLQEEDLSYTSFIHILHQIYQIEGQIEVCERLDNIKIQMNIPMRLTNEYQSVLLDHYISMGKLDTQSKIYSINNEIFQAFRIKSTKKISSTQRIAPQPASRVNEETVKVQTSLSEQKPFQICKCFEFTYRPNVVSEEEKLESNKIVSPNLSPINKPSSLNQADVATFDIEDRINTQMHSVEKAVSKVLEQVLSEIMTFKGKRINVQFRNSKHKQKSFETSPSNSSAQQQNQRNTSVPNLQQFRTTIPEKRETNTNQQQQQQPSQHPNQSLFKQIAIKQMPLQTSQNFGSQPSSTTQSQQMNSVQQTKRQQGTQLLRNLRENDSKVQQLEQSDQFKPDEITDDLKNSMKYIPSNQEDPILQKSQTSFGVIVQPVQTQGSEKSPCFKVQKSVTINEIENQSEEIKQQETIDLKQYYKENLTYLLVDDSTDGLDFKVKQTHQFDQSITCSDASQKIKSMFEKNKIYHFIIVRINLPKKNGIQFIQEIRQLENQHILPKQYFVGIESNISQTLKQSCIQAGFDEVQEKPLKPQYLAQLIESRLNPPPGIIWKPITKSCSIMDQQEKINQIHKELDQIAIPQKISSFQDIPVASKQPQFRKAFYYPIVTIYILDDSSVQLSALSSMKFNFKVKVEFDRTVDAGLKRFDKSFEEKKIYHIVLVKMNFTQKNGLEILQQIREMEKKYLVPKQFIVAIDSDFTEDKKTDLIKQGFDDALTKLIDKRLLEGILQKRLEDD
ncbi:unnamed protein product (macronuclear) [Paramecium tetraurelia]|uniref:Response regulatory domain-containing protein n=1 Tax=Paramecium tetraurelia TaxID=5888 RepID=A0DZZ2_PARTE|nr:uncharacterized protein GSPATT00021777001 [Paramecium tetraurelia]CAK88609.1 unnamed protein product [Paramecium tetraurelia]|eukprot:XP_001456006.1 hypothetical protein (macronuclear) [Paramecium tetraurelia strain d4-2]